jgi:hypothetical protein
MQSLRELIESVEVLLPSAVRLKPSRDTGR